jgi:hypothetical protein
MPYDKNNKWVKSPGRTAPTNHVRPGTSRLIKDDDMRIWLMLQTWSDFAQSLYDYCLTHGGLTEKQMLSAEKMRIKVDPEYDPYGEGVWEGVYIDDEDEYIFKISIVTKNNDEQVRSIRKRLIDMPGWSDIKLASNKALLFGCIKTGTYRMLNDDELIDIGRRTGICCDCGKVLDNPKSIAAGIGPYCAKIRSQSNQ